VCIILSAFYGSLYSGVFFQFIIGLIGAPSVCTFTRPLMVVAVGFKLTYFHLSILCVICWKSSTVLITSHCIFWCCRFWQRYDSSLRGDDLCKTKHVAVSCNITTYLLVC